MTAAHFAGQTFNQTLDGKRLAGQLGRVFALMSDGRWRTLREICLVVGGSEAAISARLRDFRKAEHGGHTVDSRRRGDPKRGLFEYRLVRKDRPAQLSLGV